MVLPPSTRECERSPLIADSNSPQALVPVEPLDYDRMIAAVRGATAVATDSGGLQKEAFVLGTPTTTIRTETEWVETLVDRWNVLSPAVEDISANITRPTPTADRGTPYGSVWRR